MSFLWGGVIGLVIISTATTIGLIAPLVGCKRVHAMGCLILPVLLQRII